MSISIVTPSYNQAEFLESAISSVVGQGCEHLEYVIVDGGSSDESRSIIEENSSRLAWWCSEPDGGQYAAINKGFAKTSGDIMGWLNASDLYLPHTLKTVQRIFDECPSVNWITSGPKFSLNENGSLAYFGNALGYSRNAFRKGLHGGEQNYGFIQQESCFWRRSLWDKIGGQIPDQYKFAADFHLWSLFFEHSPLTTVTCPFAAFRYHGEQRSGDNQYLAEVKQILEELKAAKTVPHEHVIQRALPEHQGQERFSWKIRTTNSDDILFHPEISSELFELNESKIALLSAMEGREQELVMLRAACAERLSALETCSDALKAAQSEIEKLKSRSVVSSIRAKIFGS